MSPSSRQWLEIIGDLAFNRDPAFIRTIDLDPRRLFETRRLIETRRSFEDLRYLLYVFCVYLLGSKCFKFAHFNALNYRSMNSDIRRLRLRGIRC